MSEEQKRTVKMTLNHKFGVSEKRDERRPRRDDSSRDGVSAGERPFRGDRPRGVRGLREDGSRHEGEPRFDRERRPRRFGDKPFGGRGGRFGRDRRDAREGARDERFPVYRQRPEQKAELVDENLDEAALEARAAQAEQVLPTRLGSASCLR